MFPVYTDTEIKIPHCIKHTVTKQSIIKRWRISLREYDTETHTKKTRITLKIERIKGMSNAENCQWDYKGLTFLDNNSRHISM